MLAKIAVLEMLPILTLTFLFQFTEIMRIYTTDLSQVTSVLIYTRSVH